MTGKRALSLNIKDNVAVALERIEKGDLVEVLLSDATTRNVTARKDIPFGFKIALEDISKGGQVFKYGEIIGKATEPIKSGDLVHVENIQGIRVK